MGEGRKGEGKGKRMVLSAFNDRGWGLRAQVCSVQAKTQESKFKPKEQTARQKDTQYGHPTISRVTCSCKSKIDVSSRIYSAQISLKAERASLEKPLGMLA